MAVKYYLGIVDYLIIVLTLLISTAIGFKFKSSSQKTGKMREYFMAGKNMSLLPVIMSTTATLVSPLILMGVPAESYKYGIQMWTMGLGTTIGVVLAAYIFIPVYFQCEVFTVYEFIEMRFGRPTRYFISIMFILQMVLWMSTVLYSPVLAMSAVTDLPVELSILVFGTICAIYCAVGGLKAVLWTDVFQIILMFAMVLMLYVAGIKDAGGFSNIIERAKEGGRLNFFNLQLDFVTRYTFWNGLFQGILCGLAMSGISQTGVQRLFSLSTVERAKSAVLVSNPLFSFLFLSSCLHGVILYAVYSMCDPILNKRETGLTKYDQLVPHFLVSKFHSFPGLTGLSVAGIFSGSLTTISSILNSLATVTVVDFVHPIFQSLQKDERKSLLLAKGLSLAYGAICICISLSLTKFSSLTQVGFLFHNTFEGPTLAIFIIGVLTTRGFGKSVLFSLLPGFLITQWIGFSSLLGGYNEAPLLLNTRMCKSTFNLTHDYSTTESIFPTTTPEPYSQSETFVLNKMPYFWVRSIGFIITLCCTYIGIFITDRNKTDNRHNSRYLSPVVRIWKKTEITENHEENISI